MIRLIDFLATLVALLGLMFSPLSGAEKLPIPDMGELESADKALEKQFRINAARTPLLKSKLSAALFEELAKQEDNPIVSYAILLRLAPLTAELHSEVKYMLVLQKLDERYEVDLRALKVRLLREFPKKIEVAHSPGFIDVFVVRPLQQAINDDNYEIAKEFAQFADEKVIQTKKGYLKKPMREVLDRVNRCEQHYRSIADEIKRLENDADDARSALAVGRYRCFLQKDWTAGLPLLAKASDPVLAKIARQDLDASTSPEQQRIVADAWYQFAETSTDDAQEQSRRRALYWYRESLPGLKVATEITEVSNRIAMLEKEVPLGTIPWGAFSLLSFEPTTWKRRSEDSIVSDLSGRNDYATVNGAEVGPGRAGKGIVFGPKHSAALDYSLNSNGSASICVWVNSKKFQDLVNGDFITGNAIEQSSQLVEGKKGKSVLIDSGPNGIGFQFGPDFAYFLLGNKGKWLPLRTLDSAKFAINTWYHLAGTCDGETAKFYVNGHLQSQAPFPYPHVDTFYPFRIASPIAGRTIGFDGSLDELAVYQRALTSEEVDTLYRMGVAGKPFSK